MICPRCADEKIEVMATSPVKGVWTVYQCQHCLYTWRIPSRCAAPAASTIRKRSMTQKDIDEAPQVPHVRRYCRKISVNEKGPLRAYPVKAILPAILKLGRAQTACDHHADWDNLSVGFLFRKMIKLFTH
jgi:hypothetical protein